MKLPLLSAVIFTPLLGAIAVGLLPRDAEKAIRGLTLGVSGTALALSALVLARFDSGEAGFQMVDQASWVPGAGAAYRVGVDGISLWLVMLTAFLVPVCVLASSGVTQRVKAFHVVLLLVETGMLGVFLSLDLLLFYLFWEGMLIPMYFLIGIWGYERRVYAAIKFFIYTLAGSLLMLGGIVALYFIGGRTFDLETLIANGVPVAAQKWLFLAFFASFAVKVPIFPFHTWLPDAHTEAPTAGSVILAGVLLKMGAYGFLRFSLPLFPDASRTFAIELAILGVIGIVYGGAISIVQKDIKRLVAYSSVSHLGFVVLGIAAMDVTATSGSVLQMVSHGLSTGGLFLLIGMIYSRAHTRQIADLAGLSKLVPVLSGVFLLVALSSLGLPGLNGFVGEFLILAGSFHFSGLLTIIATSGVVLAAVYLLWAYERVFTGPTRAPQAERGSVWRDMRPREAVVLVPLVALIIFIGVYPKPFLERIEPSVGRLVGQVQPGEVARR